MNPPGEEEEENEEHWIESIAYSIYTEEFTMLQKIMDKEEAIEFGNLLAGYIRNHEEVPKSLFLQVLYEAVVLLEQYLEQVYGLRQQDFDVLLEQVKYCGAVPNTREDRRTKMTLKTKQISKRFIPTKLDGRLWLIAYNPYWARFCNVA